MAEPVPPHNPEAEAAVLGAVLLAPVALERLEREGLEPADFYRLSLGRVYEAMLALAERGDGVDVVTVTDELVRSGAEPPAVGWSVAVHALPAYCPSLVSVGRYARIVRECAEDREKLDAARELGWAVLSRERERIALAEDRMLGALGLPDAQVEWVRRRRERDGQQGARAA